MDLHTYLRNFPNAQGRIGEYVVVYLPDVLVSAPHVIIFGASANSFRDVPPRFTTANAFPATWAPLKFT